MDRTCGPGVQSSYRLPTGEAEPKGVTMTRTTSTTLASVTAVALAYEKTGELSGHWTAAYAAVSGDLEAGHSTRDISAALQAAKVKANKDTVSDYGRAHRLTVHPDYAAALVAARTSKRKDGTVVVESGLVFAHTIIADARKGRGATYVDGTLSTMEAAIADGKPAAEALEAAIRSLRAAKRPKAVKPAAPPADPSTGDETGEETAPTVETAPTTGKDDSTSDSRLAGATGPLERVIADWQSGADIPSPEAVTAFLAVARRLATLDKKRKEAAAA